MLRKFHHILTLISSTPTQVHRQNLFDSETKEGFPTATNLKDNLKKWKTLPFLIAEFQKTFSPVQMLQLLRLEKSNHRGVNGRRPDSFFCSATNIVFYFICATSHGDK